MSEMMIALPATSAELEALNGPALVALYNELTTGTKVKKFTDKKTALMRTGKLVYEARQARAAREIEIAMLAKAVSPKKTATPALTQAKMCRALLADPAGYTNEEVLKKLHEVYPAFRAYTVGFYRAEMNARNAKKGV